MYKREESQQNGVNANNRKKPIMMGQCGRGGDGYDVNSDWGEN
jgi:hypothetical protein